MRLFNCIEDELKVKLLPRVKSTSTVYRTRKSEIQYLGFSLQLKEGTDSTGIICLYYLITGKGKALVENRKKIESLQERISLTSVQLLIKQNATVLSM